MPPTDNTIAVIGLGYIGLPTAVVLAAHGRTVIGVDTSEPRLESINRGELPFVEAGLDVHLRKVVEDGSLTAQRQTPKADVYIIAVPTPLNSDNGVDVSFIDSAADAIAPQLDGGELVILESTSPPGTTEYLAKRVRAARPDLVSDGELPVDFAHCPERVLPGRIVEELVTNDRIIGGLSQAASERARDVYASFCTGDLLLTDATTAEMAKLTENSFRDVNIAFANELSLICDDLGLNVWELIELANRHPRVNILQPGPGVGGHCIAVDPWFIVAAAPDSARLIKTARNVNDKKPLWVLDRALRLAKGFEHPTFAVLGLAFKKNIDDLRESPAVEIVKYLSDARTDATLLAVEPNITELPPMLANRRNIALSSLDEALANADIVLLLVDHDEFSEVGDDKVKGKPVIDTRGQWRPKPSSTKDEHQGTPNVDATETHVAAEADSMALASASEPANA